MHNYSCKIYSTMYSQALPWKYGQDHNASELNLSWLPRWKIDVVARLSQVLSSTSWNSAAYSEILLVTRQYTLAPLTSVQPPGICMSIASLHSRAFGICVNILSERRTVKLFEKKTVCWRFLLCSVTPSAFRTFWGKGGVKQRACAFKGEKGEPARARQEI